MISKRTSQYSYLNNLYVKAVVEQIVQCYELHEALSCKIRHLSQVEQQAAFT